MLILSFHPFAFVQLLLSFPCTQHTLTHKPTTHAHRTSSDPLFQSELTVQRLTGAAAAHPQHLTLREELTAHLDASGILVIPRDPGVRAI